MTAQIALSGGPLGGTIFPVDDPVADSNGVPGTVLELSYEQAQIDEEGSPVIVEVPCFYRVSSITSKRIAGVVRYSGQAVYTGS